MKKLIKKLLRFIIPGRFLTPKNKRFNRFIKINDSIGGKPFHLYFREDSFMERVFLEKGLYGEWEKESLKIWAHLSKDANKIIDIGANTGVFSMLACNNNPDAKIIAIEPIDINFGILMKNILKNKFHIHPIKAALSNVTGTAKMFMIKDRLNYMTSVNDNRYLNPPQQPGTPNIVEVEVPTYTFQDIEEIYSYPKIDLVKIDVEGHEIPVLENMMDRIKKDTPVLLIEVIGDDNAEKLNKMFKPLGYKFISIDEQNISRVVENVWDNNHHNFLFCDEEIIRSLQQKGLVA
jgi:FkbM family methyltransferase